MREIARAVNRERSIRRVNKSWSGKDPESLSYQSRWAKQIFIRIYSIDRMAARKWLVSKFGKERALELLDLWVI